LLLHSFLFLLELLTIDLLCFIKLVGLSLGAYPGCVERLFVLEGILELSVSLFLNCLSVLELLNQVHFKHLHLHYLLLFLVYQSFFFCYLTINFSLSNGLLLLMKLHSFNFCHFFSVFDLFVFDLILVAQILKHLIFPLYILSLNAFLLPSFLLL
jgi:hypothetical protein